MVRRAMAAGFASGARASCISSKNRKLARVAFAKRKNRPVQGGFAWGSRLLLRWHLRLRRHRLVLDRFVLVALQTILVTNDLPVQLVDHQVDRRVKVAVAAFDKNILALQMQVDFNLLSLFLFLVIVDREDHTAVDHLIEMS